MGNVDTSQGVQKDTLVYPAAFDSVMGVGAVDSNSNIAEFSVIGSYPKTTEITAPGVQITSTWIPNNDDYGIGNGTSFAAPLVSGVAALVKTVTPGISVTDLRSRLRNTANDAGRRGKDSVYGYGILNAYNAVTNTLGSSLFASEEIEDIFNFPNPITGDKTTFIFTARNNVEQVKVLIYDFRGELKKELTGGSMPAGEYRIDWDLTDKNDNLLNNGSYIYIMEIEDSKGSHRYKEVLSIAR
jgi:subtilisin family serine protease